MHSVTNPRINIRFTGDTVIKTGSPDMMRIEAEKAQRAYEIGRACELFSVPRILEYDEASGVIIYERLEIKPIFHVLTWGKSYNKFGENIGRALAVIHRNLILPDDMHFSLPSEYDLPGNGVFLHGDFSSFNICIGKDLRPSIVIIDWQITKMLDSRATFGTRYFDLIWFINNLIFRPTINQPNYFFKNPVSPVVNRFLKAYFKEANITCDLEEFRSYAHRIYDLRYSEIIKFSSLFKRILLQRSYVLWKETISHLQSSI